MIKFKTSEEYFREQDAFIHYILEKVNPERRKNGLPEISAAQARVCFAVLIEQRYK